MITRFNKELNKLVVIMVVAITLNDLSAESDDELIEHNELYEPIPTDAFNAPLVVIIYTNHELELYKNITPVMYTDETGELVIVDDLLILFAIVTLIVIGVIIFTAIKIESETHILGNAIDSAYNGIKKWINSWGSKSTAFEETESNAIPNISYGKVDPNKTVEEVLKDKKGSIKNAPFKNGKGGPGRSWRDILKLTMAEIARRAATDPWFREIWKLLTDRRFDKRILQAVGILWIV